MVAKGLISYNTTINNDEDYLPLEVLDDSDAESAPAHQCVDVKTAVAKRHTNCLSKFSDADLSQQDSIGHNALHLAAKIGDLDVIKYLLDRLPSLRDAQSSCGETPAHLSVAHGDSKAVEMILSTKCDGVKGALRCAMCRDINGTSILMAAVVKGDSDLAMWLLKRFGKVLALLENNSKILPIHMAAGQGNIEFIRAAIKYENKMVHARDEYGCIPCVYAVQGGCLATVRYLVEKAKSEVGSVSNRGQSLLHIACLCGHEHIVRWLLHRSGTDAILWTTNDRATALHCAAFCGSVPVMTQLLTTFGKRKRHQVLALKDSRGNTPLHLASINNHLDVALYMLENGADPSLINTSGHSPQSIASVRGHREMERMVASYQTSKKKKSKKRKKSDALKAQSLIDFRMLQTSPGVVTSYSNNVYDEQRGFSPREMSSGYSSTGDQCGSTISEHAEVVRHRLRFIEDATESLRDTAAQTEVDTLEESIKVLDDKTWAGLGLSVLAQFDRVLDLEEKRNN